MELKELEIIAVKADGATDYICPFEGCSSHRTKQSYRTPKKANMKRHFSVHTSVQMYFPDEEYDSDSESDDELAEPAMTIAAPEPPVAVPQLLMAAESPEPVEDIVPQLMNVVPDAVVPTLETPRSIIAVCLNCVFAASRCLVFLFYTVLGLYFVASGIWSPVRLASDFYQEPEPNDEKVDAGVQLCDFNFWNTLLF